jgi:hypothetical protein
MTNNEIWTKTTNHMRNYLFTTMMTSAQDKITDISKASAVFCDLLMPSLQSKDQTNAHSTAGG